MNPIVVVFGKEVLDGRRDKRAVMSALIFPALAPAFVYFMITALIGMQTESRSTTLDVEGADNAPGLVQWLEEQDVSIESFDGDAKSTVANQQAELVLIIPDDFQSRLGSGKPAIVNSSRTARAPMLARPSIA
ncbi:MAG: hypothetical protein U5O39_07590 [Gammaproteobacteria bacterium]|nr:hypothetical protein [Gammaproteobacteria bacterium]